MVGLESMALSLAKTIVKKAAGVWIVDRRTTEVSKKGAEGAAQAVVPEHGTGAADPRRGRVGPDVV